MKFSHQQIFTQVSLHSPHFYLCYINLAIEMQEKSDQFLSNISPVQYELIPTSSVELTDVTVQNKDPATAAVVSTYIPMNYNRRKKWKSAKIYAIICLCLVWFISISMIVMGIVHIGNCPKQRYIPLFLVVGGSLTMFSTVAVYFSRFHDLHRCLVAICNAIYSVTFSWYFLGCLIIYGLYIPEVDGFDINNYCHRDVYLFSFWLLNAFFILCGGYLLMIIFLFIIGLIENYQNR
ncbi:hypothetical protein CHUAL_013547 [Chamberlinius hualienensis]